MRLKQFYERINEVADAERACSPAVCDEFDATCGRVLGPGFALADVGVFATYDKVQLGALLEDVWMADGNMLSAVKYEGSCCTDTAFGAGVGSYMQSFADYTGGGFDLGRAKYQPFKLKTEYSYTLKGVRKQLAVVDRPLLRSEAYSEKLFLWCYSAGGRLGPQGRPRVGGGGTPEPEPNAQGVPEGPETQGPRFQGSPAQWLQSP